MALIPQFFLDCVLAIGLVNRSWIATGFLYGYFDEKLDREKPYRVYLVTNKHVFEGKERVLLRCNPESHEPAKEYDLDLLNADKQPLWFAHPRAEVDIAVMPINFNLLSEHKMKVGFFSNDKLALTIDGMKESGMTEGDFAYILGFPMGIVGEFRNTVIARGGNIARIRDTLSKINDNFLVDALIFPGNSGGPVINKPEITAIEGTEGQNSANLIGIVHSYIPFIDVAISRQTGKPRVTFEENSGLAQIHPVDFINEAVELHIERVRLLEQIK